MTGGKEILIQTVRINKEAIEMKDNIIIIKI